MCLKMPSNLEITNNAAPIILLVLLLTWYVMGAVIYWNSIRARLEIELDISLRDQAKWGQDRIDNKYCCTSITLMKSGYSSCIFCWFRWLYDMSWAVIYWSLIRIRLEIELDALLRDQVSLSMSREEIYQLKATKESSGEVLIYSRALR
jgi:Arc/MetJ family transcription regulator